MADVLQRSASVTATYSLRGTLAWMAPELLRGDLPGPSPLPSKESDMYSVGMVMWEVSLGSSSIVFSLDPSLTSNIAKIFTGRIPFDDVSTVFQLMLLVPQGERPPRPEHAEALGFSDLIWAVIQKCWSADPAARPSCPDVVDLLITRSYMVIYTNDQLPSWQE